MNRELSALWISGPLGYIEQLCLTSALDTGHSVILYTYEGCGNAPTGVDLRDGREIMPEKFLIKHSGRNSYALAADFFRYFLLSKRDTCWTDADMLFLRPRIDDDYIMGWADRDMINNAILRLPSESQVLRDITAFVQASPIIAPWWKRNKKAKQWMRSLFGTARPVEKLEWGLTGPKALTYFAKRSRIEHRSAQPEVYYPNHWTKANDVFDPDIDFTQRISDRTTAVHLWNEHIKRRDARHLEPSCFLAQQCERLGISIH